MICFNFMFNKQNIFNRENEILKLKYDYQLRYLINQLNNNDNTNYVKQLNNFAWIKIFELA